MARAHSDLRWLALARVSGLGRSGFKHLVDFFGDPTCAFDASPEVLGRIEGVSSKGRKALSTFDSWEALSMELDRAAARDACLVRYSDEVYPDRLREIPDPPPILFVRGSLAAAEPAIGVVGSRTSSAYGREVAKELCTALASLGICVVSGMARGIDAVAHAAALSMAGRTLAVLGSGIDVLYPRENRLLAEQIASGGAVISEFSPGTPPLPANFPVRNRIISGVSLGIVVIEATERSGSLITARLAAEQNREVFAVPGQVGWGLSRGTHHLIKQGAKLVESVVDILEEVLPQLLDRPEVRAERAGSSLPDLPPHAHQVVHLLDSGVLQIEQLIERSGLSAARVSEILLDLELRGIVRQLPGKRFELH